MGHRFWLPRQDQPPPPSAPPPGSRADGGRPERQRPRTPRGGRCTQGGGGAPRLGQAQPRAKRPGGPPAYSRITRYRPTTERRHPGRRKRSGRLRGRPGEGGGADQGEEITPPPLSPPRHTDPLAADRAALDAHGRPATPTARVYPRGARRKQKMTGAGGTGHPMGQGGGEQQSRPSSPPSPRSPPGLQAAGAPALRPPRAEGTCPLPQKGQRRQGGEAAGPARRAPRRPPPPAPAGVVADGRGRTSAPEGGMDHARGRHATTN